MLDEIKSLVEFVNKCKVQHLEIFTREDFNLGQSKMGLLFEKIKNNQFRSKELLKASIYGEDSLGYGFEKMFTRFQEKLANTLFFIDTRSSLFSERAIAYYNCSRRSYIARILLERGLRKFAISLVEKTLTISIKYEFTDLSIFFLRTLMRHYSTTNINLKKYLKHKEMYISFKETLLKELTLEIMMDNIAYESNSINYMRKTVVDESQLIESVNYSTKCLKEDSSIDVIIAASKILLFYFKSRMEYAEYKDVTFNIIRKIQKKPFKSIVTLESLISSQLTITAINKDSGTAEFIKNEYFHEINIGNFNWYVSNMYYALTMMHSGEFQKAYMTIQMVLNFKTFEKLAGVTKENFLILQAYSEFLVKINKIVQVKNPIEFRLNKFLNQVPEYSRDKQGINIPIILVQILFFLAEKKYSKIIDRIESLSLYAYRHLKKDASFRSQCFIRMLSEAVRADFKLKGTLVRTEKLFEKLKAVPFDMFPVASENEIIPYEDLWQMILQEMD